MSSRHYADWLKAYMDFTSGTEAPEAFNLWVGVWTIAGALRRKVYLDMGHFQWIPNFYLFLVAPPGVVSKSTTLSIGSSMLRDIEGIKFGPEALTWQALVEALGNAKEEIPMQPGQVSADAEFFPMSCISIAAGELGTLIAPNNREMIDALVSLWDGKVGVWEKWTKTSGSDMIVNPYVNIASCTTPAWIAQNFPEELVGGGFTSRCIFVYGDEKRQLIAYPSDHLPPGFLQNRAKLVHDLEVISTLQGKVTMTEGARAFGRDWYAKHYTEDTRVELDRFAGYRARKQTHIHKLAIVLSAATRSDLVIDEAILRKATTMVDGLEKSMRKVFESIGLEGAGKRLALIYSLLEIHRQLPKDEVFRRLAFKMSVEEFDQAVTAGQRAGILRFDVSGGVVQLAIGRVMS